MCFTKYYFCFVVFFILKIIDKTHQKEIKKRILEIELPSNSLRMANDLQYSNGKWETNDPILDRICRKTGCSCGSNLMCEAQDIVDIAKDIGEVVDRIDGGTDKDDENGNLENKLYDLLRCGVNGCKGLYKNYDEGDWVSDSFTEEFNLDSTEQTPGKIVLKAALSELNDINNSKKKDDDRFSTNLELTPEDLYEHYRPAMNQVRETILDFIKYDTDSEIVKALPLKVRKGIQVIKEKYRRFNMSDKSLKKEIFQVLLDYILKINIVPNVNPDITDDIFIPEWMYQETLKKKKEKLLTIGERSVPKRILPLTFQQKIRLTNQFGPKKLLKFVWRRSLGSDLSQYGVPFTLDIQGLGQLN